METHVLQNGSKVEVARKWFARKCSIHRFPNHLKNNWCNSSPTIFVPFCKYGKPIFVCPKCVIAVCIVHLQVVVSHLRRRDFKIKCCKDFRARELHGLADLLYDFSMPGFAKWRWTTLGDCCKQFKKIWESFRLHFDPAMVQDAKDQSMTVRLLRAIDKPLFTIHFKLVDWIADWLCKISNWIGGCPCHTEELLHQ